MDYLHVSICRKGRTLGGILVCYRKELSNFINNWIIKNTKERLYCRVYNSPKNLSHTKRNECNIDTLGHQLTNVFSTDMVLEDLNYLPPDY